MKLQMQNIGLSHNKSQTYYSIAAPSFFGDHSQQQAQDDHQTMKDNCTFIEEKAREHLKDWFVKIEMSEQAPELILTLRKGAYRHAPDYEGFRKWLCRHDF